MQVELAPHLWFGSLESGIFGPSRTWRKISLLSTYPMSFHFTFIYVLTVESESCAYIGITIITFTFITPYGIDAVCIIGTRICTVQAFIIINTFAKSVTNKSDITLTFIRALRKGFSQTPWYNFEGPIWNDYRQPVSPPTLTQIFTTKMADWWPKPSLLTQSESKTHKCELSIHSSMSTHSSWRFSWPLPSGVHI